MTDWKTSRELAETEAAAANTTSMILQKQKTNTEPVKEAIASRTYTQHSFFFFVSIFYLRFCLFIQLSINLFDLFCDLFFVYLVVIVLVVISVCLHRAIYLTVF